MDTVKRSSIEPVDQIYDGFISYSHAADDLLAPRLQSALQRFAKPWWKRRAVRIFRDESSLSANPHLWSSITEALDTSGWFVLLLSPDAAKSEWVSQEIAYWVERRDPKKILPVVTDGEFGWAGADVDGDAVPGALRGVFSEEPRWVDVRWAKDEDQLDLKDPRFADAIADIASTIRGVPKDDLASEEVRQHRRTVRTAWAGVSLIGVLAVASVGFGVNAASERDRANSEADRANTLAEQEASAREEADANAAQAAANADEAEAQAALAKGRELAASSINVRESDPELATLLAIEAIHAAGGGEDALFAEGLISLREATYADRLVARRSNPTASGRVDVAFTPDGSGVLVTSEADRSVSLLAVDDLAGEPIWTFQDLTTNDIIRKAIPHPDGSEIAVIVVDRPFAGDPGPAVELDTDGNDASPGRIIILDPGTGSVVRVVTLEGCVEPLVEDFWGTNPSGYSPSGSYFHVLVEGTECAGEPPVPLDVGQNGFWDTVLLDTSTWTEVRRLSDTDGFQFGEISFTADETRVLVNFEVDRTELRSFPDFELLETFDWTAGPVTIARISPDGQAYYAEIFDDSRPSFWSAEDGAFFGWGFDGIWGDAVFTPGGLALVYGSDATHLFDPAKARLQLSLPTKGVQAADVSPSGRLAVSASLSGGVALWRLDSPGELLPPSGTDIVWVNPNEIIEGPSIAIRAFTDSQSSVFVVDPRTGDVVAELSTWAADVLPDGRFVMSVAERREAAEGGGEDGLGLWEGPLIIRDLAGESVEVLQDCVQYVGPGIIQRRGVPSCPDGSPLFTPTVKVSRDGSRIAAMAVGGEIRIWDSETLEVITNIGPAPGGGLVQYGDGWVMTGPRTDAVDQDATQYIVDTESGAVLKQLDGDWRRGVSALSRDGRRLFLMEGGGRAFEYDTTTWKAVRTWQAQNSNARGIAISDDDTKLAVSGEDGLVVIWRVEGDEPELLQRVPANADRISDIVWTDDERLSAVLLLEWGRADWQVIDLSTEAVIEKALSSLVRGFSDTECETYRIDPCPTLDEMRSR
ncbi:MAG: toll/interleukin-1 receptor domain-containing protein [Acidimicrobiia bacterium]|nr:toll/interleukin-1 receptor domain-containing protein [Acidimicrobiia bacterium]